MKPISHGEIPLLKRAPILGYWWYSGTQSHPGNMISTLQVAENFGIPPQTVSDIIYPAVYGARVVMADIRKLLVDAVPDSAITSLDELLPHVGDKPSPGLLEVLPEEGERSCLLGEMAVKDNE